jgi:hypothetical protein
MELPAKLRATLAQCFGADLRALALFRIAVGAVLLLDLLDRSRDVAAHYTDAGVLPAPDALREFGRGLYLSLHWLASGSTAAEAALFVVQGVCALALLLGFHTRIATVASWYLLVSLQARNPYLASMGGDKFLRLVLFFGIFLPLGARFSLDARRLGRPASNWVASLPSAALLLQIALMYVATGLAKNGLTWWDGTALTVALDLEQYHTAFSPWLRDQQWLHAPLTHATRWFEMLGPLVPFVPWRNGVFRMLGFLAFVGFHLGLATFLDIGPFPIMCIAAWFAFLPAELFDRWLPALSTRFAPAPAGPARVSTPRWAQLGAGVAILYVVLEVAADASGLRLPAPLRGVGTALRLTQSWEMFAPNPSRSDAWLVVEGHLSGGGSVDLWTGGPVSLAKPDDIPATAPDFRWRLYSWYALLKDAGSLGFAERQERFVRHLCRDWNARHADAERLVRVRTLGLTEPTGAPPGVPPQVALLAALECPDGAPHARLPTDTRR